MSRYELHVDEETRLPALCRCVVLSRQAGRCVGETALLQLSSEVMLSSGLPTGNCPVTFRPSRRAALRHFSAICQDVWLLGVGSGNDRG